jgi:hypothetical protein
MILMPAVASIRDAFLWWRRQAHRIIFFFNFREDLNVNANGKVALKIRGRDKA